jgi:hypothetical protein
LGTRQPSSNNTVTEETTMHATLKSTCDFPLRLADGEPITPGARNATVESLAADLTDVVYRVALRQGLGDRWLELQLDLWRALTEALEKRRRLDREIELPYDPRLDVD